MIKSSLINGAGIPYNTNNFGAGVVKLCAVVICRLVIVEWTISFELAFPAFVFSVIRRKLKYSPHFYLIPSNHLVRFITRLLNTRVSGSLKL